MERTLQQNISTIQPKKGHQTDQYSGPLHPQSRLRHGTGTYNYPNKYFKYTGNYEHGVKQGQGTLSLGDGTVINGTFHNNELMGFAKIKYGDGSWYEGNLKEGEKDGKGHFKSMFEEYEGQYVGNKKEGRGVYKTRTVEIDGNFKNNKADGKGVMRKFNYLYDGQFRNGVKEGQGTQECKDYDNSYKYAGCFNDDKFDGKGRYEQTKCGYTYDGEFKEGNPILYPNQFRVFSSSKTKQQNGQFQQSQQTLLVNAVEYEVECEMAYNIVVQSCFQGPQELDPVQPTPQDIEKMTKDWQNENKKNKNPPPMPDFNQPRMIKPELVVVSQETQRPICLKVIKQNGQEVVEMKVDYRQQIKAKKEENQVLKAQQLKKAEEEGNKKGGKKDPKAEGEFKVNVYNDSPKQNQKTLTVKNENGKAIVQGFELPDDFPQATYQIVIASPFCSFGEVKEFRKELIVKAKATGKKK